MSSPRLDTLISVNANTCFFTGLVLNSTLVWLVFRHTPSSLRTYSRVLAQIAVVNILSLTTTVFFASVQLNGSSGSLCYGVGWLMRPNSRKWNFWINSAWFFMVCFTQYSVAVPFIYRYFILCHQRMM